MSAADECIWAKRATCLTADVVMFCFGPDAGSISRYLTIKRQLEDWDMYKPPSFAPVYFRERDPAAGRYFPDICFLLDAVCKRPVLLILDAMLISVVVGLAYFHLSLILMTIFDPTLPKIGSKYLEGRERIKVRFIVATTDNDLVHVLTLRRRKSLIIYESYVA